MRFSVLAGSAGCTAAIAPGGAGDTSTNPFPGVSKAASGSFPTTTIAAGSNGAALPQATINVADTTNGASAVTMFPSKGIMSVTTSNGPQIVTYTGLTGTTFTGCAGGTGTMSTGGAVSGTTFGTYSACGTNINATITHANWFNTISNLSKAQIVATNATGAANVSPDGTSWIVLGDTSSTTQCQLLGYFRCDDTEDADLDPFLFFKPSGTAGNAADSRRTAGSTSGLTNGQIGGNLVASGVKSWFGWRRRGFITTQSGTQGGDAFASYAQGLMYNVSQGQTIQQISPGNVETVACSYTTKIVRERLVMCAVDTANAKHRKGTVRWMWMLQSNSTFDTFDGKQKMVIVPIAAPYGSFVIGPMDGSTTPAQ